ncbi:hypothetical protein ABIB73_000181 [Bradyrhizobium sp. F1.4.3]|uniref:hypothetical protein n=1 Tax=Bradyrhizobium sp. F1.4.3 TaxID=3156356 RepID=UPI0033945A2F
MCEWRQRLIDRFPELFDGATVAGHVPGLSLVDDGWQQIVCRAIARISTAVGTSPLKVTAISRRSGVLRLDYDRSSSIARLPDIEAAIQYAIALAEAGSACTCERCGREGCLHQVGSELVTACLAHANGVKVREVRGFENLHVVRSFDGKRQGPIILGRYDRITDVFVAVDPRSLPAKE